MEIEMILKRTPWVMLAAWILALLACKPSGKECDPKDTFPCGMFTLDECWGGRCDKRSPDVRDDGGGLDAGTPEGGP
jgi:hypothetical protein